MTDKATSDLWWKDAVVYCVDVATWLDSDGDGIGDLAGLTRRLDYLSGLGVNCLWLMPF
jgi:glycosidase